MKKTPLAVIVLLCTPLLTSCFQAEVSKTYLRHPPFPTKDDVALVNGVPLTLRGYLEIRTAAPTLSPERALWAGMAALALQAEAKNQGRLLSQIHALAIARYALEDLPSDSAEQELTFYYRQGLSHLPAARVRQDLEELLARSVVIKSPLKLSQVF